MQVNKEWLEGQIKDLNDFLQLPGGTPDEMRKDEQRRNYYVNKLIELEENELETIKV